MFMAASHMTPRRDFTVILMSFHFTLVTKGTTKSYVVLPDCGGLMLLTPAMWEGRL